MIPAFLLIVAAVGYRVAMGLAIMSGSGWLSNFAPLAAIALCGAVYFRGSLRFAVPLGALFISDCVLNAYYDAPMLTPLIICRYLVLGTVGWLGLAIANRPSLKKLLLASLAASLFFYVVTNTFSWLSDPGYVKNVAGFVQALTVGLPQYSSTPTWMFFRNSVISDLLFTVLFFCCVSLARSSEKARAASALPHTA